MALNFDKQLLDIPCPHCGHHLKEQIGRLNKNPTLTCGACRNTFRVNADKLRSGIAKAEKSIESLKASLRRALK